MKIKELKEVLEQLDQEGEVYLVNGCRQEKFSTSDMETKVTLTKFQYFKEPRPVELGDGRFVMEYGENVPYTTAELVIYGGE